MNVYMYTYMYISKEALGNFTSINGLDLNTSPTHLIVIVTYHQILISLL